MIRRLALVEWDSDGKVCRILSETLIPPKGNVLDDLVVKMDRPHRLNQYDIDWCKRDDAYYGHFSGCWTGRAYLNRHVPGYRSKLWLADGIQCCGDGDDDRLLSDTEIAELGYDVVELAGTPEDLSQTCEETSCYWCSVCEDMLPQNDHCEHQRWCDACGVLLTVEDDPCAHPTEEGE